MKILEDEEMEFEIGKYKSEMDVISLGIGLK